MHPASATGLRQAAHRPTSIATLTLLFTALLLSLLAAPAPAQATADEDLPEHANIMLLGAVWTGSGWTTQIESFHKCVDLPVTPLNAHFSSIHWGNAAKGLAKGESGKGSHMVIPVAPFPGIEFSNCADFEELFEELSG